MTLCRAEFAEQPRADNYRRYLALVLMHGLNFGAGFEVILKLGEDLRKVLPNPDSAF